MNVIEEYEESGLSPEDIISIIYDPPVENTTLGRGPIDNTKESSTIRPLFMLEKEQPPQSQTTTDVGISSVTKTSETPNDANVSNEASTNGIDEELAQTTGPSIKSNKPHSSQNHSDSVTTISTTLKSSDTSISPITIKKGIIDTTDNIFTTLNENDRFSTTQRQEGSGEEGTLEFDSSSIMSEGAKKPNNKKVVKEKEFMRI